MCRVPTTCRCYFVTTTLTNVGCHNQVYVIWKFTAMTTYHVWHHTVGFISGWGYSTRNRISILERRHHHPVFHKEYFLKFNAIWYLRYSTEGLKSSTSLWNEGKWGTPYLAGPKIFRTNEVDIIPVNAVAPGANRPSTGMGFAPNTFLSSKRGNFINQCDISVEEEYNMRNITTISSTISAHKELLLGSLLSPM